MKVMINVMLAPVLLIMCAVSPAQERVVKPKPALGALNNPLKGWCPYITADTTLTQPYSMAFVLASWRELEPKEGDYRFKEWEERNWNSVNATGKHIVFRVFIDHPNEPTGIPQWLLDKGLKTTAYSEHGGGRSPDYENAKMKKGMKRLIAELGRRYDKNPRVAFIQLGLLGFWGEWHTSPHPKLFASAKTQELVIDAFHNAFPQKILMARNPIGYAGQQSWLGFHDDAFPADTEGSEAWMFLSAMRSAGRMDNWKSAVIGGEMVPDEASKWLGAKYEVTKKAVEKAHFTWMGPYCPALEKTQPDSEFEYRSQELVRKMGYEFILKEISHPEKVQQGKLMSIVISGLNQGVAPFYYRWPVELVLLDESDGLVKRMPLECDIRTWLPGSFTLKANITIDAPAAHYKLGLGMVDPWTNAPAVAFANDLKRVAAGWTHISEIEVTK